MMSQRRVCVSQRVVELVVQPLAVAVDDAVLQPALDRLGPHLLDVVRGLAVGEHRQHASAAGRSPRARRSKIRSSATCDLLGRDQVQRHDLADMDDGAGHAGLHRVVEEDAS